MKTTSKTLAAIFGIAATAALAVPASAMDANNPVDDHSASVTISTSGGTASPMVTNRDLIEAGVGLNSVSRNALGN